MSVLSFAFMALLGTSSALDRDFCVQISKEEKNE
jgi:hypothetical protein